jgi:hypothetical protein
MKAMTYGCGTFIVGFVIYGIFKAVVTIFL